jgi:hypothetical protein
MAHGRPMLMGARGVAARSSRTAAALWRGPCGSPSASREMRFSPPRLGNCGETVRQGGGGRSSPEWRGTGEGGGDSGVPGDGGGSGGLIGGGGSYNSKGYKGVR